MQSEWTTYHQVDDPFGSEATVPWETDQNKKRYLQQLKSFLRKWDDDFMPQFKRPRIQYVFLTLLQDTGFVPQSKQETYLILYGLLKLLGLPGDGTMCSILGIQTLDPLPLEILRLCFPGEEDDFAQDPAFQKLLPQLLQPEMENLPLSRSTMESRIYQGYESATDQIMMSTLSYRLFAMEDGNLGVGPRNSTVGDVAAVIEQCGYPVILRKVGDHYVFVGACFVLELMNGEAAEFLKDGRSKIERLEIR